MKKLNVSIVAFCILVFGITIQAQVGISTQPFIVNGLTGNEQGKSSGIECVVYPNPTHDLINLKIGNYNLDNLNYLIYDISGRLLMNKKIESLETSISLAEFKPAIYFLKITENSKELKVFRIIKN